MWEHTTQTMGLYSHVFFRKGYDMSNMSSNGNEKEDTARRDGFDPTCKTCGRRIALDNAEHIDNVVEVCRILEKDIKNVVWFCAEHAGQPLV